MEWNPATASDPLAWPCVPFGDVARRRPARGDHRPDGTYSSSAVGAAGAKLTFIDAETKMIFRQDALVLEARAIAGSSRPPTGDPGSIETSRHAVVKTVSFRNSPT